MAYQEHESRGSYLSDPTVLPDYLRLVMKVQGDTLAVFDTLNPRRGRRLLSIIPLCREQALMLCEDGLVSSTSNKPLSVIEHSNGRIILRSSYILVKEGIDVNTYNIIFRRDSLMSVSFKSLDISPKNRFKSTGLLIAYNKNLAYSVISPAKFIYHYTSGKFTPFRHWRYSPEVYYYVNKDPEVLKITDFMLHDRPLPDAPLSNPDSIPRHHHQACGRTSADAHHLCRRLH